MKKYYTYTAKPTRPTIKSENEIEDTDFVYSYDSNRNGRPELLTIQESAIKGRFTYNAGVQNDIGFESSQQIIPLAFFAADGYVPSLGLDFQQETGRELIRAKNNNQTFGVMFPTISPEEATMIDSDGILKWGPHNFIVESENLSAGVWSGEATPVAGGWLLDPTSLNSNTFFQDGFPNGTYMFSNEIEVSKGSSQSFGIDFPASDGLIVFEWVGNGVQLVSGGDDVNISIKKVGGGFNLITIKTLSPKIITTTTSKFRIQIDASGGNGNMVVRNPRFYRIGVGGMTNNPERGDSYVPTTGSIRYLSRRNHHVWDTVSKSWINKGILYEPEGRTNRLLDSIENPFTDVQDGTNLSTVYDPSTRYHTYTDSETGNSGEAISTFGPFQIGGGEFNTLSMRIKKDDESEIFVQFGIRYFFNGDSQENYVRLNTMSGELWVGNPPTKNPIEIISIEEEEEDFFISITVPENGTGNVIGAIFLIPAATTTTGGGLEANLQRSVSIRDVQVETGLTPSSYIPTNGSTVTRSAETGLTIPSNFVPWEGLSGMGVSGVIRGLERSVNEAVVDEILLMDWRLDADNRITLTLDSDGTETGALTFTMVNNGQAASVSTPVELIPKTQNLEIPVEFISGIEKNYSVAWRASNNEINIALDGNKETALETNIGLPNLISSNMKLGGIGVKGQVLGWPVNIGDVGIEAASS